MRLHLDKRSFTILTFLKVVVCIKLKLGEAGAFKGFQGATSSSRLSRYDRKKSDEQWNSSCYADCMYDHLQPYGPGAPLPPGLL